MDEEPREHRDSDATTRTPPLAGGGGAVGDGESPERRVGPYRLKRVIGAGGMGVVYEASHDRLGRPVAVKFIGHAAHDREMRRRFEQERDTLAALRHPAIAHIYDAGQADHNGETVPYIAMEYIVGARPISSACREAGLEIGALIELFESLFDALDHAHRRGILHRDLKPGNILMDSEGKPRIIDFGLSLPTGARGGFESIDAERGGPVGTYKYMSPEQRSGDPLALDHRTDIYSLALVMLEIVEELAPDAPASVRDVLDRALRPEPAQRTPSAAIVRDQLRACRNELVASETIVAAIGRGRPAAPFGVAATAFVLSGLVSYFALLPLLCGLLPICTAYLNAAERFAAPPERQYEHTAVIMIDDETLADPAFGAGNAPISLRELRPYFDDLTDRLVEAGARTIVFDLQIPYVEGWDMAPLAESFRAARRAGIPVIQMDLAWPDGTVGSLVDPVFFGASTAIASGAALCEAESWRAVLAARPGGGRLLPGLGLAAFVLRDHPDGSFELEGNIENEMLTVRRSGGTSGAGRAAPLRQRRPTENAWGFDLAVSAWSKAGATAERVELKQGDQTVVLSLSLPQDEVLENATASFRDALRGDPLDLKALVAGRIVIVAADSTGTGELAQHPGGRTVAKAYAHAETIETLLAQTTVRHAADATNGFLAVVAAFLGVGIGTAGRLGFWRRVFISIGSGMLVLIAGLLISRLGVIVLAPVVAGGMLTGTGASLLLLAIAPRKG